MEEQGKSVFREDGWLPTTFVLKAHHHFSWLLGCWAAGQRVSLQPGHFIVGVKQEYQEDAHRLLGVGAQPRWLLVGVKQMVLASPFSGAVACGDRQEGNDLGCLCPRPIKPQPQPGVAEFARPPGQLRLGTQSSWPWQGGQSPEALLTPAKVLRDS